MKRKDWRLKSEYEGLPAYAFINPINPNYLPREWFENNELLDGYVPCYTAKGIILIPESYIEEAY